MQHPLSFSSEMCIGNAQTYDALPHILRNNVILNAHKENCKNKTKITSILFASLLAWNTFSNRNKTLYWQLFSPIADLVVENADSDYIYKHLHPLC